MTKKGWTIEQQLTPRPCRSCGQWMSKEHLVEKNLERRKKMSGVRGTSRWAHLDTVILMDEIQGITPRVISKRYDVPLWYIYRLLKRSNPGDASK